MSNIQIIIDSTQVDALLSHIKHKADHLEPALTAIGVTLKENIRLTFRDLKTPYGQAWKPLSHVTIARRRNGSSTPLNDTGVLRDSIVYQLSGQAVEIGTNAPQAAMMNFGGTKAQFGHLWGDIPARQFMPVDPLPAAWERDVIDAITHHLVIA